MPMTGGTTQDEGPRRVTSTIFKIVAWCHAAAILTVCNMLAIRRGSDIPILMNIYAIACIVPNRVLVKRRDVAVAYAILIAAHFAVLVCISPKEIGLVGTVVSPVLFLSAGISVVVVGFAGLAMSGPYGKGP